MNWQDRENPQSGGAEIHLHEVFGRLAARGHEVTVLVSSFAGAEPVVRLDGMEVHRTGGRHTFPIMARLYHRRYLATRPFDVVVEDLNKVAVLAPRWRTTPAVLLVHHLFGTTAFREASFPVAAATWLLEFPVPRLYRGIPVEAVSESTAQDLVRRGFDRRMITVIENGVDLSFYTPADGGNNARFDTPTALYLGRLKRYKRIDLIIRAMARLRDRGVNARLVIAGRGDARSSLERLSRDLGMTDRIEFAGFVTEDQKREFFRRSWVHVLTSPREGWGISNMEAAACGTATVASDSPGLRDSVRDGETGFLAPHGDIDALAERLGRILRDGTLRDRLGAQARSFAELHSWDRSADLTETHLESVLARAGAP